MIVIAADALAVCECLGLWMCRVLAVISAIAMMAMLVAITAVSMARGVDGASDGSAASDSDDLDCSDGSTGCNSGGRDGEGISAMVISALKGARYMAQFAEKAIFLEETGSSCVR